jgi:hypothetical protein
VTWWQMERLNSNYHPMDLQPEDSLAVSEI